MLDQVCAIPHRSSRVTSFRRFAGAMSGGGRWPRMPGSLGTRYPAHSKHTERGGWVFIVAPISAVLQPYKVISIIGRPKNCG